MVSQKPAVYTGVDLCKAFCCILVVISHLPSIFPTELMRAYFNGWYFRFCVPFFFACSGYFFYKSRHKMRSLLRITKLFILAYLLYLPEILAGVQSIGEALARIRWNMIVGHNHLWYLNATLQGMLGIFLLEKIPVVRELFRKAGLPMAVVLFLLGALLDEYYSLVDIPFIQSLGEYLLSFKGGRNVVFMGFPLLVMGGAVARYEDRLSKVPTYALAALWIVLRTLALLECSFLFEMKGLTAGNDVSFFGCWPGVVLLAAALRFQPSIPTNVSLTLRKLAEYVYILHMMVSGILSSLYPLTPVLLLLSTIAVSCSVCLLFQRLFDGPKL